MTGVTPQRLTGVKRGLITPIDRVELITLDIKSNQTDSGNTPTTLIRALNVVAKVSNQWRIVSDTGTDGTEMPYAILLEDSDLLDKSHTARDMPAQAARGGLWKGSAIIGLTARMRELLRRQRFEFDDDVDADLTGTRQIVNLAAATQTITNARMGERFVMVVDGVLTLPAVAAANKGCYVDVETGVASAGTGAAISPNAADHIRGNGLTEVDNKDLINSGASDRKGDFVRLYSDGVDGWVITEIIGTWAKEA